MPAAWKQFTEANGRMRKMYDDWIEQMCDLVGGVSEVTVVDTAANAGFFPYRFLERGAHRAIAYDMNSKLAQIYDLLNVITGFEAEFVNTPYDQMTHEIPGAEKGDIVISSAIMCHLSDPLYYLNFLSSITKKALFLFTSIDDSKQLRITYREPGQFYPEYPFPICFDNMTTVSRPLIELGLRELGFKEIVELEYRKDWLPMSWYKQFKAIVALR